MPSTPWGIPSYVTVFLENIGFSHPLRFDHSPYRHTLHPEQGSYTPPVSLLITQCSERSRDVFRVRYGALWPRLLITLFSQDQPFFSPPFLLETELFLALNDPPIELKNHPSAQTPSKVLGRKCFDTIASNFGKSILKNLTSLRFENQVLSSEKFKFLSLQCTQSVEIHSP